MSALPPLSQLMAQKCELGGRLGFAMRDLLAETSTVQGKAISHAPQLPVQRQSRDGCGPHCEISGERMCGVGRDRRWRTVSCGLHEGVQQVSACRCVGTSRMDTTVWVTHGVCVHMDHCFEGDLADMCSALGVVRHQIPPEAPHQMGSMERLIHTLKCIAEKVIDAKTATNPWQLELCVAAAATPKKRLYH